ncbi:hypothetical protein T10_1157 [Trichinella papuae]|uniref:Uncharacterized protein n=1 Tax=Trichinella papuae TaxID=268474 RepID=A0A0V1M531_9BILA|nr:hypothetical protein T10_1157 [Trichinella papuae]
MVKNSGGGDFVVRTLHEARKCLKSFLEERRHVPNEMIEGGISGGGNGTGRKKSLLGELMGRKPHLSGKNSVEACLGKSRHWTRQNFDGGYFVWRKRHLAEKKPSILIGRKLLWARKYGG